MGSQKKSPRKKGEIIKKILLAAGKGVTVSVLLVFPPLALPFKTIMEIIEERKWKIKGQQVKETLKRLEKQKLVDLREEEGELLVTFRKKGKEVLLKYKIDELEIPKPKRWDGKWRIVIFDIPEKKKLARNILREKLKELEFHPLQKSVFVHPYDCERGIELIKKVYEVEPFVRFIVAESIDNQEKLIRKFKL
jgi:DNA-binding transcriptional regulator PaaX